MRKFYLSFLMLVLCMASAVANPVTPDQALLKAKAFRQTRGLPANAAMELAYQGRQASHQHGAPAKDAYYYVFNNGGNTGFVIVAGDDCAESILGYADSGSFDADNIPENMLSLLNDYAGEIQAVRACRLSVADEGSTVEVARKVVAPLIETHWNQRAPYNQKCFMYDGTTQCVTGCVATALAQVMYYHRLPKGETTDIPGYSFNNNTINYASLSSTTFEWDKMKPAYINTGNDDPDAEEAVAQLMLYCGHAVKMNYGPSASGASSINIPNALKNYFGYPGNPTWVTRSEYTTEEWDELIYNELKNSRPVLYSANTSGNSGHEFICDGYDGHGLYHINWGWGGLSDGYYRLQALRPSGQGTGGSNDFGGYSLAHDVVIGVSSTEVTSGESSSEEPAEDNSFLTTVSLTASGDNPFSYSSSYGFYNPSVSYSYTLSGNQNVLDVGVGLYQDGILLQEKAIYTAQELSLGAVHTVSGTLFLGLGTGLADGVYQVKGINRIPGTEEWYMNDGSDRIYVELTISNGQVTYTNVSIAPEEPVEGLLQVTSIEQRFDLQGYPIKNESEKSSQIRAYVTNIGETDYSGSLHLLINGSWVAEEGVYIPVGGTDYVDFFFPARTGTVNVVVASDYNGNSPLYTNTAFTLNSGTTVGLTKVGDIVVKNLTDDKYDMYGSVLDGYVVLKNETGNDFEGNLTLEIWVISEDNGSSYSYSSRNQLIPVNIKAGETKNVPFFFSALAIGDDFAYTIYDPDGQMLGREGFFRVLPGVVYWTGTGERTAVEPTTKITVPNDVVAVSFEDVDNFTDVTITPNSNDNTIYYFAPNTTTPTSLIGKNVVKGYNSDKIALSKKDGFYIPQSFTASKISFSYVPTLGADGKNGWQTITLPFAVQKVTSGGKEVDWYHGNDTSEEKDFWLREFKQVAGNVVQFADVAEWIPNVPYLIAVPGDRWGAEYDMTNKLLEFSASNVRVEPTTVSAAVSDNYEFVGVTGNTTIDSEVYVLNEKGSSFVKKEGATLNGCSAYFTINNPTIETPAYLNIGFFDTTGICMPRVTADDGKMVDVYAIDGVKVATVSVNGGKVDLNRLPKGIYIVEGKKIVR